MSDLISRQAAIDEAEEWIDAVYCEDGDQRERDAIRHVIHGIKELPAVQTEVLKCKDCYWWTKQSDSLQGRCDRYGFYPTGYWYCAAARERRTDESD